MHHHIELSSQAFYKVRFWLLHKPVQNFDIFFFFNQNHSWTTLAVCFGLLSHWKKKLQSKWQISKRFSRIWQYMQLSTFLLMVTLSWLRWRDLPPNYHTTHSLYLRINFLFCSVYCVICQFSATCSILNFSQIILL